MSTQDQAATNSLIGRLLLASACVIGLLAVAFWTGVFPLDDNVRPVITAGAGVAALADALLGVFFLWKSAQR